MENHCPLDPFEDRGFSLYPHLPLHHDLRVACRPPPQHDTPPPHLPPLLAPPGASSVFPVRFRRSKAAPLDSPMQGHTDEARGRFTSQHAHVVPGGVHAARVFGMGWGEAETKAQAVKVPSIGKLLPSISSCARPSLAFSWVGARHQTTWQRTSDGRRPLPGVPDTEHSSPRLP